MKSLKPHIYFLIFFFSIAVSPVTGNTNAKFTAIQAEPVITIIHALENVRMRTAATTNSGTVKVYSAMTKFVLSEKGPKETINGKTDYWYKVKSWDESAQTGYIFGHYLSVRHEGRREVILKYTNLETGDFTHYLFTDIASGTEQEYDISQLNTNLEFSDESGMINQALINKKFRAVVNRIPAEVPAGGDQSTVGFVNLILEATLLKE